MESRASVKVPDGKLIKIDLEYDNTIKSVKLHGDFFIEPPKALDTIEERLKGLPSDIKKEEILNKLDNIEADLIGFSRENIAEAVRKAIEDDKE